MPVEETKYGVQDLGTQEGIVKRFNDEKGFGFIGVDGQSNDVFVHFSEIMTARGDSAGLKFRTLSAGARVKFELFHGAKGLFAVNVQAVT